MVLFIDAVIVQVFVVSGMFLRPFRLLMTELIRSVAVFATTAITLAHPKHITFVHVFAAGVTRFHHSLFHTPSLRRSMLRKVPLLEAERPRLLQHLREGS